MSLVFKAYKPISDQFLLYHEITMYQHLALRVLFQSCMFMIDKYWSWNRSQYIVVAKYNNNWWSLGLTPWQHHRRAVHVTRRINYTGPSVYGFHIWSADVLPCAKPKGRAPLMRLCCICVALAASVSVNFWPSVVPLKRLCLLSRLLSPSWLNGCKCFLALRFLS